jgi:hypothetical protein
VNIHSRSEMGRAISILPILRSLRADRPQPARSLTVRHRGRGRRAARHPLARNPSVRAADLAHEPFIALTSETLLRQEIDRMFSDLGLLLNIRGEASAGIATCQMVARGLGFTLADPLEAHYVSSDQVVVRELVPRLCFTYGFLWPAWRPDGVDGSPRCVAEQRGPRSEAHQDHRAAPRGDVRGRQLTCPGGLPRFN